MNQYANCLQYQTKRVVSVYQKQCYSRSPKERKCLATNQQFSPNQQKYMKQFKCIDQYKYQQPKAILYPPKIQSPTKNQPLIATKLRIQDKENSNPYYNSNIIFQPCKTPRDPVKQYLFSQQNSPNAKQTTPQFENRYNIEERNQENRLSNSEINFRFVDSEQHTSDELQIKNISDQFNNIEIPVKEQEISLKSMRSDEFLVQMDSVKKLDQSNTKNIGIQAFESIHFEKPEEQLGKIFGSLNKVKIVKKKQTQPTLQTQVTQRTMEDDNISKMDTQQDLQTQAINGQSNRYFQCQNLQTEYNDFDSHRLKKQQVDEQDEFTNFRQNIATPKQLIKNNISFLMYKKQFEENQ